MQHLFHAADQILLFKFLHTNTKVRPDTTVTRIESKRPASAEKREPLLRRVSRTVTRDRFIHPVWILALIIAAIFIFAICELYL